MPISTIKEWLQSIFRDNVEITVIAKEGALDSYKTYLLPESEIAQISPPTAQWMYVINSAFPRVLVTANLLNTNRACEGYISIINGVSVSGSWSVRYYGPPAQSKGANLFSDFLANRPFIIWPANTALIMFNTNFVALDSLAGIVTYYDIEETGG